MRKSGGEPMSCGYSPTPPAACAWSAHSPSKPTKTGSKPTATSIWTNCASRRKPNYAKQHDQHHDRQFAELDAHNHLACNPVLSIMLRERKGGCPWCSPGGSCHHRQRAALAAHYTRPILPAAFCKMGAVAAATATPVCGERGSEARSPCRHADWLSLSAASGKAEGRRAGGGLRRPARGTLPVTARKERYRGWQVVA